MQVCFVASVDCSAFHSHEELPFESLVAFVVRE